MSDIAEFEIWIDEEFIAGTHGPRNEALNEAITYYNKNKHDCDIKLYEVKRILIQVIEVK